MAFPTLISAKMPTLNIPIYDAPITTSIITNNSANGGGFDRNAFDAVLRGDTGTLANSYMTITSPAGNAHDNSNNGNFAMQGCHLQSLTYNNSSVSFFTNATGTFTVAGGTVFNERVFAFNYTSFIVFPSGVCTTFASNFTIDQNGLSGNSPILFSRKNVATTMGGFASVGTTTSGFYTDPLGRIYVGLYFNDGVGNLFFNGVQTNFPSEYLQFVIATGLSHSAYTPVAAYSGPKITALFGTVLASPDAWQFTVVDQNTRAAPYNVVPDDVNYQPQIPNPKNCPYGFLVQRNPNIATEKTFILSPDGSHYWPINLVPQTAAAKTAIANSKTDMKFDRSGTLWIATTGAAGGYIGYNKASPSAAPEMVASGSVSLLNPFLPILPVSLPCYPACSNPPLLVN